MTNMGGALGRWAVYFDLSVIRVAVAVGVTRQSVYNWMKGGEIFPVFKPRVQALISIMERAHAKRHSTEQVWSTICKEFDLRA